MRDKHVANRFARLTDDFIDACQKEHRSGTPVDIEELSERFPPEIRTLIARESIDADRLVKAGPEVLIDRELNTFGDWMLLCVSDLLAAIIGDEDESGDLEPELLQTAYKRSNQALTLAADSATASPLVNYTALFMQLAYLAGEKNEAESVTLLLRAVANENWQNDGEKSEELLLELVGLWNRLENTERADELLAALIRWAPDAIAYYHLGSHYLREAGRNEAALALARRGLELVGTKGDEEDLGQALKVDVEELLKAVAPAPAETAEEVQDGEVQKEGAEEANSDNDTSTAATPGDEGVEVKKDGSDGDDGDEGDDGVTEVADVVPTGPGVPASKSLIEALTTDFDGGEESDVEVFCAAALPELTDLPAKRDLTSEDLDGYEELDVPETFRRQGPKVGRNEPCPCGSGKKYKRCCAR
jgi:tetratricopeptide (TPR) repeat protein